MNFDDPLPNGSAIEETNALALAIIPSGKFYQISLLKKKKLLFPFINNLHFVFLHVDTTSGFQSKDFDPTGWELALVTTPSTNISSIQDRQLVTLQLFLKYNGMESLIPIPSNPSLIVSLSLF